MTPGDHTAPDRLAAVRRYEILDAPVDGTFDHVAEVAAATFDTPIALVTIVDADRVWFAASHGIEGVTEVGVEPGLCTSAVLRDGPYVVDDAAIDPRTLDHPLVRGELGLRFYAAVPITAAGGHRLGTVNVIDREARQATDARLRTLATLAAIVSDHLELRLAGLAAVRAEQRLRLDAEERATASARLAARLQAAAHEHRRARSHRATCQLGRSPGCAEPAELKVADTWGDSAWGCVRHIEEVMVSVRSAFIADESTTGIGAYLTRL
ncbi:GAF domain-containing protein [Umezawaea sp. Da 62-37]|uniref:GAF domain-containing protein n=1 Tax=Umezawaea sp. Da 62-37 TaxID=3075927 RepID=UPI0028F6CE4C|nr:GAF domain-containing protein [Umezawaea sp. Da 62-37]WNV88293.1 GAF domain-containing protein [Umezawaea sp. Da 62-37]